MFSVSARMPWPAKAASPWRTIGNTLSWLRSSPSRTCLARARPSATGSTASRWLGFETRWMLTLRPSRPVKSPVAPMWYLTSPPPKVLRGSTSSKPAKISAGVPADGVHHHVQAAAMAHRDDHLLARGARRRPGASGRGAGCSAVDPLEREALGAEVAGLEDLLEDLGADEQVEDALAGRTGGGLGLHALLDPAPALRIGDVHELDADRAAVVPPAVLGGRGIGALEAGLRLGLDAVHRVQIRQQIAQAAVGVQSLLVQRGGALGRNGRGSGYGLHNTVRIPQLARGADRNREDGL